MIKRKIGRPKGAKNKKHAEAGKAVKVPLSLVNAIKEIVNLFRTRK